MFRFALVAAAIATAAHAAISADEVTSLPGWSDALPSKQYSGLIEINPATGKSLHYWFVESENDPANSPVVLWLNGGPGCSSLDGYFYEQGPFHVNESDHTQLYYNEYTWAKKANMIFLESPAGVGFSYSRTASDYRTNDTQTANDAFTFLNKFFTSFSEYKTNEFRISGESYAGVYVPTLAARVLKGNEAGESNINLKGIAVGNGCTGNDVGICGGKGLGYEFNFLAGHGLISVANIDKVNQACTDFTNPSAACLALVEAAQAEIGDVDIYDIYSPCINGGLEGANPLNRRLRAPGIRIGGPDECIDGIAAAAYLNTAVVQSAIHVSAAMPFVKEWTVCSGRISYDSTASNLPKLVYPDLVSKLHVLIYNGDVDACVPYLDNEAWTSSMGYPVSKAWHPWSLNNQVAGYSTVYDVSSFAQAGADTSFTFITVKGSGHMVPQYRPAPALEMFTRWINNEAF